LLSFQTTLVIDAKINEMCCVAKENIALNPTIGSIDVYENNLLVGVDQKSDLIVANILAEILVQMPEDAYRNLNDNGTLILSGIIESKAKEVQEALKDDKTVTTALTSSVANKLDYSQAQSLSTQQKQQACANLGIGDPTVDLVSVYTTARDSV